MVSIPILKILRQYLQSVKPIFPLLICSQLLEKFVEEFFDQNPLSQLSIIAIKNKRAEKVTELSGNVRKHIKAVQGYVFDLKSD